MQLAGHSRMIASALAIAAIAAPAASARPNPGPQVYLNPSTGFATPRAQVETTSPRPEVHPNPDQQTPVTTQVGPPILRSESTTQASRRAEAQTARRSAYAPAASARYSSAGLGVYASAPTHGAPAAVRVITHGSSFDWGDAAIGAGGGLVVSLLVIGGTLLVVRRRQPEARPQHS